MNIIKIIFLIDKNGMFIKLFLYLKIVKKLI